MNTKIILLATGIAALSSCSTAYKAGQTPDDVYFSPARPQNEYVAADKGQDSYYAPSNGYNNRYNGYADQFDTYRNDRFLRMSIGNPMYMSTFNNYGFDAFSSLNYNNYAYNFNSPWNGYYYWNSFYNPYSTFNYYTPYYGYGGYGGYGNVIIAGSKSPSLPVSRPRAFSPGAYTNYNYSNSNLYLDRNSANIRPGSTSTGGRYNNSNSNPGTMRRVLSSPGNNSYYNNSNNATSRYNNSYSAPRTESYTPSRSVEAPVRSYTPSSSGGSSGGGGMSRPGRGGR